MFQNWGGIHFTDVTDEGILCIWLCVYTSIYYKHYSALHLIVIVIKVLDKLRVFEISENNRPNVLHTRE